MDKIPCSVGVLTFNSGKTLRRALESVKDFDDLIVCDGGSTDDTLVIAEEYGAHVISQDPAFQKEGGGLKDYAGVRNQCLDVARHDWFFYIDSDEVATPELLAEIRAIVSSPTPENLVYNISPRIVLDGRLVEHSSNYPGWQKRFFNKKTSARFRKAIHERITYNPTHYPEGFLREHWHYFISSVIDQGKLVKYARMDALHYQTRATGRFLHLCVSKIATMAKVFLKVVFIRARYGSRESLPFALEMSRVRYQWHLLGFLTAAYFGKEI